MGIAAGKLNRLIEIFEIQEHLTPDGDVILDPVTGEPVGIDPETGAPLKTLIKKADAWASVSPVRGFEKMQHGREEMATLLYTFRIRFANLKASDILKLDGAYWEIQSLAPRGRINREIVEVLAEQIDVKAIVND